MTPPRVSDAIRELFSRLTDLDALLKTDAIWAPIADKLLEDTEPAYQKDFWLALEQEFKSKEASIGHLHKGQIYWNLAILDLVEGDLSSALDYLGLAGTEDKLRGSTFSAAIGLSSVVQPMVYRFKTDTWRLDEAIMSAYGLLTQSQRREFANVIVETHNIAATGRLRVIKPEAFTFIADESKRRVCQSTYDEILAIIQGGRLGTFYSCIFSTGSILEGMFDDLFERDDQRLWKLFRDNPDVMAHVEKNSRLQGTGGYDPSMTLGGKVMILRLLAEFAKSPIPGEAILPMLIIGEYRDLIHPRRRLEVPFEANAYVAGYVFTLISVIAHFWWPENIAKQLAPVTPLSPQPL